MKPNVFTLELSSVSLVSPMEALEFINLLNLLVHPITVKSQIALNITFPPNLGIGYRSPGIGIYVDFVIEGLINMPSLAPDSLPTLPRVFLQLITKSAQFLFHCVSSYNLDSTSELLKIGFASSQSADGPRVELRERLTRHPGALVMAYLFDGALFFKLTSLLSTLTPSQSEDIAVSESSDSSLQ